MATNENLGGVKMDLNQFLEWQEEKPKSRAITIKAGHGEPLMVWVYDRGLRTGQFVQSVDEIDLEAEKDKKEKAEYERLKKKFEDKKSDYKSRKAKSLTRIISLRGEKNK